MAGSRLGMPNKRSLLAIHEIERLGLKPIEMMAEVYKRSMAAYIECRGLTDKSDAGASYLSVAGQMATKLASFQYPTLGAIAIQDMTDKKDIKQMTTAEAVKIINGDPFLARQLDLAKPDQPIVTNDSLPIGIK